MDLELPGGSLNSGTTQILKGQLVSDASTPGGTFAPTLLTISLSSSVA